MKKIFNQMIVLIGLGLSFSACHKSELVSVSTAVVHTANGITKDTLSGTVKGTMLAGKTYYIKSNVTVNDGDTLAMQSGVHLIVLGDGKTADSSPEIFCHGTFISLGTKDAPNYITVKNAADLHAQANQQQYDQPFFGWWGGITCTPAVAAGSKGGDLILKWTHVEFGGAPAGSSDDPAIYPSGPRFNIYYNNVNKNVIIEDSWFFGAKDDNIQIGAGHISCMRNTFELCGGVGGEFFNIKTGSVADIGYNVFIGSATNAMKISNSGGSAVQCNAVVYNNTIIDGGYRQTKSGRGGSIDFEKGAKGLCYNNLIVNCRFGLRITADADVANVKYGYNGYYGSAQPVVDQFYAADSQPALLATGKATTDVRATTPKTNNPMFYLFNVDQYDYVSTLVPISYAVQQPGSVMVGNSSFRLQAGSPFIGKGRTDFSPLYSVTATGTYGADITLPGKDLGAYQTDGTGNQH
ncbi:hypothetical protein C8P68_102240 [Mucilaginibacter yixingensis]|uniref:Parallel beta helix pectate lyase-like protein n=1 Tax=Mucilaginibacter yixingensis TaxID=1295612 RepID=A0A2T5JCD2_9SPHI|nr:hypothetical protein [Mucilaginibacter yixingensis]PTQ99416.1 hypothetical protein C8P68_102240 [Mucilaginibacter yixingensis]